MMSKLKLAFVPIVCLPFAGCAGTATPIVAGAVDHVGVVAGASPQMQGAGLSVGYRGAKFAIVPVETRNGELILINDGAGQKSYSVFTQLGVEAKGGSNANVAIEQVVAVGPAADAWVKNASASPAAAPPSQ